MHTEERRPVKVVVTGSFDVEGFQRLLDVLKRQSDVKNLFFSVEGAHSTAAATFFVETDKETAQMEAAVRRVFGVNHVLTEEQNVYRHAAE